MNAAQLFAFIILPLLLVGIGGLGVMAQHRASVAAWRALQPRLKAEAAEREATAARARRPEATVQDPVVAQAGSHM